MKYVLMFSCPDQLGIVYDVVQCVYAHGGFILHSDQHSLPDVNTFFSRLVIQFSNETFSPEAFRADFDTVARKRTMVWELRDTSIKKKVVLLCSKGSHCIEDLLYRWHMKELNCDIAAVVSNHPNLRKRTEWYGLPFHHVPVDSSDKESHFKEVDSLISSYGADVVVLARYMQIFPEWLCEKYNRMAINIHHGFLPSFAGARPYHQAYARGVKMIGATAHYVTSDLDQGPIIEQDIKRIDHRYTIEQLVRLGREIESSVLARAVASHIDDRIIVSESKTIVF